MNIRCAPLDESKQRVGGGRVCVCVCEFLQKRQVKGLEGVLVRTN